MTQYSAVSRKFNVLIAALGAAIFVLFWAHIGESRKFTESTVMEAGRFQELRGSIRHLDEVLTMAATMAAATSEPRWTERYRRHEPMLRDALAELQTMLPNTAAIQTSTDLEAANNRLVALEDRALDLAANGRSKEALAVLSGEVYRGDKSAYTEKLDKLFEDIRASVAERMAEQARRTNTAMTAGGISFGLLLVFLLYASHRFHVWRRSITNLIDRLQRAETTIAEERDQLEIRVAKRTEELDNALRELVVETMERANAQDRAEAANAAKSRFLAVMTHELKTPLNAIAGFASLMARNETILESEKLSKYVRNVLSGSDHMQSIVGDLLDLSKIESGHVELVCGRVNLSDLAREAVQLMQPLADREGITLEMVVDPALPLVEADAVRIRQVMINLLGNSLKFSPAGYSVMVLVEGVDDDSVRFSVIDQGPGLAETEFETIFEQYAQSGTAEQRRKGNGLGLPLSRELARLHGGRLWVESAGIGTGCTFVCELPVKQRHGLKGEPIAA